jgi:hypothetical protein
MPSRLRHVFSEPIGELSLEAVRITSHHDSRICGVRIVSHHESCMHTKRASSMIAHQDLGRMRVLSPGLQNCRNADQCLWSLLSAGRRVEAP